MTHLTFDEIKQIATEDPSKWIKVGRHIQCNHCSNKSDCYEHLIAHHTEEMTFLINLCKTLAKDLIEPWA